MLRLPDGSDPLQTFEGGRPLGDTRFLNFGPGIQGTLIGDDFVQISASAGIGSPWDAVVDANAAGGTDEANRIFLGIGEALTYLTGLGLTRANVFVRPGAYVETVNVTPPASVFLFGAPGGSEALVTWDRTTNDNKTMSATNWHLCNIKMDLRGFTSVTTPFGPAVARFYAENCAFNFGDNVAASSLALEIGDTDTTLSSFCYFINCSFRGMRKLGANVFIIGGDSFTRDSATPASHALIINGLNVMMDGPTTWTLPIQTAINFSNLNSGVPSRQNPNAFGGGDELTLSSTTGGRTMNITNRGGIGVSIAFSGTGITNCVLNGVFTRITVPSCNKLIINAGLNAATNQAADITGPGIVNLRSFSGAVTLRGSATNDQGVTAQIQGNVGNTTTFLSLIGMKYARISVSSDEGGTVGKSPYNLDATSDNNILDFAGASTYGDPGVDSGAGNIITQT